MTRFLVVPQWQGSPSARAMRLGDGAHAIADDLPRSATTVLDVPSEAGESLGTGLHRLSALLRTRALVDEALAPLTEPVLLVGGDCGVSVGAVAHAAAQGNDLAVVWFDAHPDLHSPETSPSGAFGGMVLRAILGEGVRGLTLEPGLVPPSRVVLAGTRSFDDAEQEYAAAHALTAVAADAFAEAGSLAGAVRATGAGRVFVHVDLDVLDPSEISGVTSAQPFGLTVAQLVAAIGALRAEVPLAGAAITGFSPSTPAAAIDDLGAILRIVGALA
ncbi:MAG TPA: arginase family protein [Microbacterium sp.]|uniref:arginase family protein n=1 Tax=Microbacterium sp. TaxID=51671 RepID=UPI002C0561A1|nr:arginase family protein [Microbacterium sp.]HWI31268.1 arginase family protein [Microbacterium sp.]